MSKLSRLLSLITAGIFIIGASQAQAIPFVFTAYGTVSSGFDVTGLFGAAGTTLSGKSFSQSISFDPAQNAHNTTTQFFSASHGPGATAFVETEVDGHAFSSVLATASVGPYVSISNFLTQLGSVYPGFAWSDSLFASVCGNAADAQFSCLLQSVSSTVDPFIPVSSLDQAVNYTTQAGDPSSAFFYTSGVRGTADFNGTISAITLHTVPEPATLVLLGVGLLGLGSLKRRKRS